MKWVAVLGLSAVTGCADGWGPFQAGECDAYVDCFEAAGGTKGSLDSTYGPMGNCWTSTPARADQCAGACKGQLQALRKLHPDAGCRAW